MCKFSNKLKQPLFGSFQGKPAAAKSLQSCPTLCEPWTVACQALRFKGFYRQEYMEKKKKKNIKKNTGVGCQALLQGIFLTQGLNPHLLHLLHHQAPR